MASFIGRLQNILVSKLFAVVLISLLLSCLSIFPIANASAQPCDWNWDILSISGIKTNYQPGETISGNISFRLHNKANSGAIQQLLIGIIDSQNKVIDVKCVYNGAPKDCPEWTTGTASFSLKAPVTPGNYKVIAADDLENSCSDAINRFPSLCSSTSPYCKDITTITISAGRTEIAPPIPTSPTSPPPTLPSQPDTGKKNGTVGTPDTTKPSGGIAPIALNKNTIIIISFVAALVILTLFASRKKGSKHFTKSILLLVLISFICYLFWVYAIPPIADWFRYNLSTIIGVLLSLGALAIAGTAVWIKRDRISKWIKELLEPIPPHEPDERALNNVISKGIFFEQECKAVLEKMGFSCETTKISGDGGIDLRAHSNQPFFSGIYIIQCKDWKNRPVGEKEIRDLYGTITSERANKGILITSSYFTKAALSFAQGKNIELIDGNKLNKLIGHQ